VTRQRFTPHAYQRLILDHLGDVPRSNVWAGMGLGKGTATLTYLADLYERGVETAPTLVVAPLRVAQSTWPDECAKWQHLSDMEVVPILGPAQDRARLLQRDTPIFSINYEALPWLVDHFKHNVHGWPFGIVVADESTKLKSTRVSYQRSTTGKLFLKQSGGSVRGRALAEVAHAKVHCWINLTGTPAPNGLKDLWGAQFFIDAGKRLGRTYSAFEARWFQSLPGERGYHDVLPLPHAQEQIQAALADCTLSLDAADWFDLKEPIVRPVYVELPDYARRLYEDMERELFMEISTHSVAAVNAAARTMKSLQLASGAVIVDDAGHWKEVHDAKLQALEDIVEEAAGMPVLVAYHFRSDLARLQRAFPRGRHLDHSPQTIHDWNAGRIPVLFAHPASAGHGLNLQDGGNILAFFSLWWDLEAYQQIIERIGPMRQLQAGHRRAVFIYHIIAHDTIDEDVLLRLHTKRSVQDILLGAMKRRTPARSET
jgi:SNF2 family DNA or RNA helicase